MTLEIDPNLNLPKFLSSLSNYRIEFRVQFLALAILFPLILTISTLLIFKPIYLVAWYLVFIVSLVVIFVGSLGYIVGSTNTVYQYINTLSGTSQGITVLGFSISNLYFAPQLVLILIGVLVAVLCLIVLVLFCGIKYLRDRKRRQNAVLALAEELQHGKASNISKEDAELMNVASTPMHQKMNMSFKKSSQLWLKKLKFNSEKENQEQVERFLHLKNMKEQKDNANKFSMFCIFLFNSNQIGVHSYSIPFYLLFVSH